MGLIRPGLNLDDIAFGIGHIASCSPGTYYCGWRNDLAYTTLFLPEDFAS